MFMCQLVKTQHCYGFIISGDVIHVLVMRKTLQVELWQIDLVYATVFEKKNIAIYFLDIETLTFIERIEIN